MYNIIIIGAGTAGMTAAIYARRAGRTVLIIEEKNYGGQIINTPEIENYPGIENVSGFEFATNLYNQVKALDAEFKFEKVLQVKDNGGKKTVITDKNEYMADSVIIATGAKNRTLGIDREEEFIGAGVSYCATCDGAFFRGKDVAVVGGGNTALEDAAFLANYCNIVYLIHRRDTFRGESRLVDVLKTKKNVKFILDSVVDDILGDDSVIGVIVRNVKSEHKMTLDVKGLFIAAGQIPDNGYFSDVVNLDEKGYISADETCRTDTKGVFTAGDCRTKQIRQLTTAASDGAVAALAACSFIDEKNTK